MSLRHETPCDFGPCPYESESWGSCEYWCGAEEPQDEPDEWFFEPDEESGEGFWIRSTEKVKAFPENKEELIAALGKLPNIEIESL